MSEGYRPPGAGPGRRRRAAAAGPVTDDKVQRGRAAAFKAAYVGARRRWGSLHGEGAEYTPPRRYGGAGAKTIEGAVAVEPGRRDAWAAAARALAARGVDPVVYVNVLFGLLPPGERPPEPPQVLGDRYWRRWQKAEPGLGEQLAKDLTAQCRLARGHALAIQGGDVDAERALFNVLTNDGLPLSSLFRYCAARSAGGVEGRRVAARYEADAVLQFGTMPDLYERHWAAVLPRDWAQSARRLHPLLLARRGEMRLNDEE